MDDIKKSNVAIHMGTEELSLLVNTLSFAKAVFEKSAAATLKAGDAESAELLTIRAQSCTIFINNLLKNAEIGDPEETVH
jgi:hypothetical protein